MKKFLLLFLFSFSLATNQAQDSLSHKKNVTAVHKGNHSINLYYGTNLRSASLKALFKLAQVDEISVSSMGTFGGMYEYMVTDKLGMGLEGSYSKTTLLFRDLYYMVDGVSYKDNFSLDMEFVRCMLRLNYHFIEDEKFDTYGFMSAGYRTKKYTLHSSNSAVTLAQVFTDISFSSAIPFGVKPGVGFRYFFIKNVGLNLELAAGTPLICGGLSFKF